MNTPLVIKVPTDNRDQLVRLFSVGAVCGLLAWLPGCDQAQYPALKTGNESSVAITLARAKASHVKMEKTLAELHERQSSENPFIGDGKVHRLSGALAKVDRVKDTESYVRGLIQLGQANIDYGDLTTGLKQLTAAYRIIVEFKAPTEIRRDAAFQLGIANLRLAETENCCASYAPESCIMPLRGAAIHTRRTGSEAAIRYFSETMSLAGDDESLRMRAQWLLNIAYMTLGDFPDQTPEAIRLPSSVIESPIDFPRFPNVALALGLATDSLAGGVVADDFDGDGDFDLIVSNWDSGIGLRYFENRQSAVFVDRSDEAGITGILGGLNMVQADYDNDGDLDVVVLRGAWLRKAGAVPNSLLQNQGNGTFLDVTFVAGLAEVNYPSQTAAWTDYDNDGNLDIFISSYTASPEDRVRKALDLPFPGEISGHFRGDGKGGFDNLAKSQGFEMPMLTMGCNFGDLNNDGFLDVYLGTGDPDLESLMPNMLFLNQGGRRFVDVTMKSGLGHLQKGHAIAIADFDQDGDQDIFEQMGGAKRADAFRDALYQNPGFGNHWIGVHLTGTTSNRSAIGARIRVEFIEEGGKRSVYRHINSGASFGGNPLQQHIGIGSATSLEILEVFWPTTGETQVFRDISVNQVIAISEGESTFRIQR